MDGAREALKPLALREVPHDGVSAGEIDRIEIRRVDLVRPGRGRQQSEDGLQEDGL